MPDFELDDESVSRARMLSSRLANDLLTITEKGPTSKTRRELFSEQRYADQAEGVPINDVVTNVGRMAEEFATARRWAGEVPCLKLTDGNLVPISITEMFGGPDSQSYGPEVWSDLWERYSPFPPHLFWREFLRGSRRAKEEGVVITDWREALGSVERNLTDFLSYRFSGMKRWREWIQGVGDQFLGGSKGPPSSRGPGRSSSPPPPAVGPGGGLQVQVSCHTPGLRIHVSPSYFITWVFFGSPTTPVTSYVLPGRYVFAGDGPMLTRRTKDRGVFSIPPTYHPVLMSF